MRNRLFKIVGGALISIVPIIYIITTYTTTEETVEVSEGGISFFPIILISLVGFGLFVYIYKQIKNILANQPFSNFTILFFGGILIFVLVGFALILANIQSAVETNYQVFMNSIELYSTTIRNVVALQIMGMAFILTNIVLNLKKE